MVYKYLLVQIHSSDLFFWVGFNVLLFTVLIFFKKEKLYGPFLWMGFNCLKATEPLRGGTLLFTTKLPSILCFPKKLLPVIFQFWYVLHNLVPFVQFKKREKHSWRSVTFGLLKVTLHECFSRFHWCFCRLCVEHRWFEESMGYAPPEDLISVLRIELRLGSVITLGKRRQQMTSFGSAEKNV